MTLPHLLDSFSQFTFKVSETRSVQILPKTKGRSPRFRVKNGDEEEPDFSINYNYYKSDQNAD